MTQDALRQLAALVAVLSTTMLGTVILLVPTAWKGFHEYFLALTTYEQRTLASVAAMAYGPLLLIMAAVTVTGASRPTEVQAALLVSTIFAVVILAVAVVILRKRGRPKPRKGGELPFFYLSALWFLTLNTLCDLFALIGVSGTMLDVEVGPYGPENFNWGRWILADAILFFVVAVYMLGIAYVTDKLRKAKHEERDDIEY